MIVTQRLVLVPATAELTRAALQGATELGARLGATVSPAWPPIYVDPPALEYILARVEPDPAVAEWWLYFVLLASSPSAPVLIGTAGYKGPPADGTVEVGYGIVADHRRRGYASEAVRGLLARAFALPEVRRVIGETLPALRPSIGVLHHCGFRWIGEGSEPGVIRFELTRADYEHGDAASGGRPIPTEVVERVVALSASHDTVRVAFDGPGGAGKTTLARALAEALAARGLASAVVHLDDFFLPSAERQGGDPAERQAGDDWDWIRLRDQVLIPLGRGEPARYRRYDWNLDRLAETVETRPGQVVIVEGVTASRREIAALYELQIWVDCPSHLRLARGLARDGEAARPRWELEWMPVEDRYIAEHRPRERADVIVDGAAPLD